MESTHKMKRKKSMKKETNRNDSLKCTKSKKKKEITKITHTKHGNSIHAIVGSTPFSCLNISFVIFYSLFSSCHTPIHNSFGWCIVGSDFFSSSYFHDKCVCVSVNLGLNTLMPLLLFFIEFVGIFSTHIMMANRVNSENPLKKHTHTV